MLSMKPGRENNKKNWKYERIGKRVALGYECDIDVLYGIICFLIDFLGT